MDTNKINELAKILRQNQLTKLDLTEGDSRIVLEAAGRVVTTVDIPAVSVDNTAEAAAEPAVIVEKTEEKAPAKKTTTKKASLKANVTLQFAEKSYTEESLVAIAKDVWTYDLNEKAEDLKRDSKDMLR